MNLFKGLLLQIFFTVIILIIVGSIWLYLSSDRPAPIIVHDPSAYVVTFADTTAAGIITRVDTLYTKTRLPTSDDFSRWSLLIGKNTELINTVSLIFVFATVFIAVVSLLFYFQIGKIRPEAEAAVSSGVREAQEYTRRINRFLFDTSQDQLELMQNYIELLQALTGQWPPPPERSGGTAPGPNTGGNPSGPSTSGGPPGIQVVQFRKSLENLLARLKLHRAKLLVLSENVKDIRTGLATVDAIKINRFEDIELLNFVLEWWSKYPPEDMEKSELIELRKYVKTLKKRFQKGV